MNTFNKKKTLPVGKGWVHSKIAPRRCIRQCCRLSGWVRSTRGIDCPRVFQVLLRRHRWLFCWGDLSATYGGRYRSIAAEGRGAGITQHDRVDIQLEVDLEELSDCATRSTQGERRSSSTDDGGDFRRSIAHTAHVFRHARLQRWHKCLWRF